MESCNIKDLAIEVKGLCKEYQFENEHALFHDNSALNRWRNFFKRRLGSKKTIFSALQDISFEVKKGEIFGIIGENGAGKSTLLKILSGVTSPTRGYAKVNGNVTSLLEVGTGFHPELTGRENIFMNGSILGMKKHEIQERLVEIIDFSEVEKFIDIPVKKYSSGMLVRLAFSVAIHLNSDILIIDEVLSVGDIAFQQKSMKALKSLIHGNCTVLIVSHNVESVRNLCEQVIVLQKGKVVSYGGAQEQITGYLNGMQKKGEKLYSFRKWELTEAPGNETLVVNSVGVKASSKEFGESIYNDDEIEISIDFTVQKQVLGLDVAFRIKDISGYLLSGVISDHNPEEEMLGLYHVKCKLPKHIFNEGRFLIDIRFLKQKKEGKFFFIDDAISFMISKNEEVTVSKNQLPGVLKLENQWYFNRLNTNEV